MADTAHINGGLVYILVEDRDRFDGLPIDMNPDDGPNDDGSHVISKTVQQGKAYIVFQHWIVPVSVDALLAKHREPSPNSSEGDSNG